MHITAHQISATRPVRVVIANQEPRERALLIELCHARGGLADPILAGSGAEALQKIRTSRPDLALLACDLKDMTGFDVLRALGDSARPATIMVAPDERHALEALAFAAADYLTFPVSGERFGMSIDRACSRADGSQRVVAAQSGVAARTGTPPGFGDRLVGERAKRLYFLSPAEVDFVEADSNYVRIHVGADGYINRDSLGRLSPLLEALGFVRISRSILLNLQRVVFAERVVSGALAFTMKSGARVLSRTGFRIETGAYLKVAPARAAPRKRKPKNPGTADLPLQDESG